VRLSLLIQQYFLTEKIDFIPNAYLVDKLIMTITTERIQLLTKLLDVASMRQDVIAQNMANLNTPGYSTLGVSFEDSLKEALTPGARGQPLEVTPKVVAATGGTERVDGNNVDIDLEMARLQKKRHLLPGLRTNVGERPGPVPQCH
jgi:flagellar basal-body rod protein FlgB